MHTLAVRARVTGAHCLGDGSSFDTFCSRHDTFNSPNINPPRTESDKLSVLHLQNRTSCRHISILRGRVVAGRASASLDVASVQLQVHTRFFLSGKKIAGSGSDFRYISPIGCIVSTFPDFRCVVGTFPDFRCVVGTFPDFRCVIGTFPDCVVGTFADSGMLSIRQRRFRACVRCFGRRYPLFVPLTSPPILREDSHPSS